MASKIPKQLLRKEPTEELQRMAVECARLLAAVTFNVGSSGCVIEVNDISVDDIDAGAWKVTVQRLA